MLLLNKSYISASILSQSGTLPSSIEGEINEQDGVRIDEPDGWLMVRASGTEPIVRLTMEYRDKKKLEKRKKEISEIIKGKIKS